MQVSWPLRNTYNSYYCHGIVVVLDYIIWKYMFITWKVSNLCHYSIASIYAQTQLNLLQYM